MLALVSSAATAVPAVARQVTAPVLFDRDMTVGAGASVSAMAGEVAARVEDHFIPRRLFEERGVTRRTANVAYRFFKFIYFDLPQEQWIVVANHEVFGHGARLRERFNGPIGYRIDAPVPYGHGGGETWFEFDREPSTYELLSVSAAGMEVDAVAARIVVQRAVAEGRMRPRDAMRYLGFELDTFSYIQSTGDAPEEPGHDVSDFLQEYNGLAASAGAPLLTPRTLRREALVCLANPMLAYAVYGIARYVWNGATDVRVPALSIAGVRYLPMLRYQLTPYGTELAVMNELAGLLRQTEIELRFGRFLDRTPWGIGVRQRDLVMWRDWHTDLALDLWRQPAIVASASESSTTQLHAGGEVRGRLKRPVGPAWFGTASPLLIVELGVKTAGYVPGEPLRAGAVARVGVGVPLGR